MQHKTKIIKKIQMTKKIARERIRLKCFQQVMHETEKPISIDFHIPKFINKEIIMI